METTSPSVVPVAPTGTDKIWSILSHLSALLGVGIVLPLVVYLAAGKKRLHQRRDGREIADQIPGQIDAVGVEIIVRAGAGELLLDQLL